MASIKKLFFPPSSTAPVQSAHTSPVSLSPPLVGAEMLRGPAAALVRRLAPHVSGGATHRRVPPPIASSLLARFSSAPTTSPPSSSSAAGRDEAADEEESPEISNGDAGARLSIAVDRSGLYNPPGPLRLCFFQSPCHAPECVGLGFLMVDALSMRQSTRTSRRRTPSSSSTSRAS
jgi:hypothetical protein